MVSETFTLFDILEIRCEQGLANGKLTDAKLRARAVATTTRQTQLDGVRAWIAYSSEQRPRTPHVLLTAA